MAMVSSIKFEKVRVVGSTLGGAIPTPPPSLSSGGSGGAVRSVPLDILLFLTLRGIQV